MVAFTESERLVGEAAKNQCASNASNTVFGVKRLIGRKFDDPSVQQDTKLWPFKVIRGPANAPQIEVVYKGEKKVFAPEEISAQVLVKMKQIAEAYLGVPVRDAVITCPGNHQELAIQTLHLVVGRCYLLLVTCCLSFSLSILIHLFIWSLLLVTGYLLLVIFPINSHSFVHLVIVTCYLLVVACHFPYKF